MPDQREMLLEWLQGRELIYRFLARLYQEGPAGELLTALVADQLLTELPASVANSVLEKGCRQMQTELTKRAKDLEVYQRELQEEYNRLFVGPGHLEAPPWESVYRSKERLLFGEETLAVREFYRSFGLEYKKKNQEPDDHLGLEMEFMAWLNHEAVTKVLAGEDATELIRGQERFLAEHLLRWVPALCGDIQKAARTDFFRGLAGFTWGWLEADAAEVKEVLEELELN